MTTQNKFVDSNSFHEGTYTWKLTPYEVLVMPGVGGGDGIISEEEPGEYRVRREANGRALLQRFNPEAFEWDTIEELTHPEGGVNRKGA